MRYEPSPILGIFSFGPGFPLDAHVAGAMKLAVA